MKRNIKYKKIISLVVAILLLFCIQTIAYSAINGTLTVKGDAYARAEADVRITNFRLANLTNATSHYEEFGKNHIITDVDLTNTSSITYYVEITNYGSVDIGIFDITGLPNGVNYSIKDYNLHDKICDENNKCNGFIKKTLELTLTTTSSYSGQIQLNFDFRTYHQVTYNNITNNNYPTEVIDGGTLNITFKENLKRVTFISNETEIAYYQSISNGQNISISNVFNNLEIKIKVPPATLVKGKIDEPGSEICVGDECFYIISNDGTNVKMFAKYNLYVGGEYNTQWVSYGNSATGRQNPTMLGYAKGQTTYKGVTPLGSENTCEKNNDIVLNYIATYASYLRDKGLNVISAELIDKNVLVSHGCIDKCDIIATTGKQEPCGMPGVEFNCDNAPSWITNTSYWMNEFTMGCELGYVLGFISYSKEITQHYYETNSSLGVRPVIEIPIEEIYEPNPVRLISGDLDTIGSEVCIGEECFLTISSTEDTVTMIAEMNISFDTSSKQQDEAGTTIYDESIIFQYLNNYKTTLTNYGASINNIRLITYDELNDSSTFACEIFSECNDEYQWIYTGEAYWTGTYSDLGGMWYMSIYSNGIYDTTESGESYIEVEYGVRPVITISKENIDTNIAKEQKDFIVFSLEGRGFLAEDGMTWQEWGESKYNTFTKWDTPLTFESTYISCPTGDYYYVCNSSSVSDKVKPTDIIIAGHRYYMKSKSPE